MSKSDWWADATRALTPGELAELERLLAKRRKAVATKKESPPQAKPDGRIYYVSSDPADRLRDFTDRSGLGDPGPQCWVDGV